MTRQRKREARDTQVPGAVSTERSQGEPDGVPHRSLLAVTRCLGLKGTRWEREPGALAAWKQGAGLGDHWRFFPPGDSSSLTSHMEICLAASRAGLSEYHCPQQSRLCNPLSTRLTVTALWCAFAPAAHCPGLVFSLPHRPQPRIRWESQSLDNPSRRPKAKWPQRLGGAGKCYPSKTRSLLGKSFSEVGENGFWSLNDLGVHDQASVQSAY